MRLPLVLLLASVLAGCARHPNFPPPPPGANKVAYFRMDAVIKKHPLYSQLAQYDSDIDAISLKSLGADAASTGAGLAQQGGELNRQLEQARKNAMQVIKQKQSDYARREAAAIRAALAAGGGGGANGSAIANSMQAEYERQARSVSAAAQANVAAYQQAMLAQERQQIAALTRTLNERAARRYRAKAEQLSAQEATYSLDLATKDAAKRLSLRTRLSSLALDDATRRDTKAQLAALDRRESDALAAMRNRDAAALAAFQRQLSAETQSAVNAQSAVVQAQSAAKLNARSGAARNDVAQQINAMRPAIPAGNASASQGLPPEVRARLTSLHAQYQAQFQNDVNKTIADFRTMRDRLQRRFERLHGIDREAQARAQRQLLALQKQRARLYSQMVAQIDREVRTIAQRRGIAIVLTNIVAPANGVDLTDDAAKSIESFHE